MFLQKYLYKEKIRLKIEHFLKIDFNELRSCQNIDNFWLRCTIISVELLLLGVNILLDTNTKTLMIAELRK